MKNILGTKVGMTQVFSATGERIPVTVLYVEPNVVLEVKTTEKDGYEATKVGYHTIAKERTNKPDLGQFKKANSDPKRFIREFRGQTGYNVGDLIKCDIFEAGELVDIQGTTKGHGFTGSIKRHNFSVGPLGHGAGYPHRYTGSIAAGRGGSQAQRVLKNTKMPGHYGHELVTTKHLTIVKVDAASNLILVKGAIPGPKDGLVWIKTSVNKPNAKVEVNLVNYKESKKQPEVSLEETSSEE